MSRFLWALVALLTIGMGGCTWPDSMGGGCMWPCSNGTPGPYSYYPYYPAPVIVIVDRGW